MAIPHREHPPPGVAQTSRQAMLELLQQAASTDTPGLTSRDLAAALHLHITTVRFHLDQLVEAGLVQVADEPRSTVGRRRKIYLLAGTAKEHAAEAIKKDDFAYRELASLLTQTFALSTKTPLSAEDAGKSWVFKHANRFRPQDTSPATTPGSWLQKIGMTIDVLTEWGYSPDVSTTDGGRTVEIELTHCPFMDFAREHPDVVCGVHLGLIRGAMDLAGETDAQVDLQPFIGTHRCLARISTTHPFRPPGE